jgi:ATP-dependent helicase/nuclease subunit A
VSETARDRANQEQRAASDPHASAFVGASAGSGKTTLLINRLLRLMLAGADPQRILCLTYTRAAAAEMAVRLQRTLGRWVGLPDAALDAELDRLGVPPGSAARERARRLFATVLDLPGGMRIATIHAFCQSLLRRFPLEASLSPHFRLIEDADAQGALAEAREAMLASVEHAGLDGAMRLLAGELTADNFGTLVGKLRDRETDVVRVMGDGLDAVLAAQRRALGVTAASEAALMAEAVRVPDEVEMVAALRVVQADDTEAKARDAQAKLDWLALDTHGRVAAWPIWYAAFITLEGKPRKQFATKKVAGPRPDIPVLLEREAERVLDIEDQRRAALVADLSGALLRLAVPVLQAYRAHKEAGGLLDYDDLIGHSRRLLHDPGVAWVLYKLDGGIDHLLLDEVQDTAPEQWQVAEALTEEFFAGFGARDDNRVPRSLFAVGDRKQSIYSFQGADAGGFDAARERLAARVKAGERRWVDGRLDVSFRSTGAVLSLVDAVFAHPEAAEGVEVPGALRHVADRAGHAGSVELWPLAPVPIEDPNKGRQLVADRNRALISAPQRLADALANWIARQTDGSVMLESQGRPVAPGDILVLVRQRNAFTNALLKALKQRSVPVGGLDRLVLTKQPAVQDLMALGDALLLPQDDLTFASLLTSPLGGLTDDSLMALATGRPGSLWETLRAHSGERADWQAAWEFFAALLARVDHVTPHALLVEALGRLGARARLLARLGPEAAEPIDEMLAAALSHQQVHPPSLQGFLHWLRQSGAEVKREQEAAGGAVRIMTVHGAKGQEARIVVLPDTTALPPVPKVCIDWGADPATGNAVPLWSPRKEMHCRAIAAPRAASRAKEIQEHNRLLYVALTRAQDRVVVCGHAGKRAPPGGCWYEFVQRAFQALPVERLPFGAWPGELLRHSQPQTAPAAVARAVAVPDVLPVPTWAGAAPTWAAARPPPESLRPLPLAPSRPEGAGLGPVPASASPLAERDPAGRRFLRGTLIHGLLQHLPDLPPAGRRAAALAWLDRPGHGLPKGAAAEIAEETLAILDRPELAPLFGPGSRAEVPLTGVVGDAAVGGLVDRLAVLPDSVLVADFKTNRNPPSDVAATPILYLRQMAAYRAVLRGIFPGRAVRCALIWTQAARVSILADEHLDPHDPSTRHAPVDHQAA